MSHPHRIWPSESGQRVLVPAGDAVVPARKPAPGAARWALLQARDVMKSDLTTVAPDCPLSEVERILSEKGIGGAPVVDASGAILGIVSASDVMERHAEDPDARPRRGRSVDAFPLEDEDSPEGDDDEPPFASADMDAEDVAADVMTADVHWVPGDADLGEIARTMAKHRIHRVLVREDGRYVGLISTLDVLDALAG
jgi:CBS domain-containing protein